MRAFLFAVLAAAVLASQAAAESPAGLFHKHGLFGTWAVDCTAAPTVPNPHVIYRLVSGDRVQRQISVEPGKIVELSIVGGAAEAGPSELVISWQTDEGGLTNRILLGEDWIQVLESTRSNGEKLILNGRRVRDNTEAPRFARCSTGQSA